MSFEANISNRPYLRLTRLLLGARFVFHLCGLGQEATTRTFYVPVQGNRRITTEGSFHYSAVVNAARRIDGPYTIEEMPFEMQRFDSFDLTPDIVKIDVQGLELDVLVGMGTLLQTAPLLMLEASLSRDGAISDFLAPFGYVQWRRAAPEGLLSLTKQPARPLNWFYATPATVERFPSLFASGVARP